MPKRLTVLLMTLAVAGWTGCGGDEDGAASRVGQGRGGAADQGALDGEWVDLVEAIDQEGSIPEEAEGGVTVVSAETEAFLAEAEARLKEHVIQIAGLRFIGTQGFDAGVPENLDKLLDSAKQKMTAIRRAGPDRIEPMKTELSALINKMDEIYNAAIVKAQNAQLNSETEVDETVDTEVDDAAEPAYQK
jgi:hypothetical protein